jgi:hypothetical protein
MIMDADLKYLVHFFTDQEYLFKTISMAGADQIDRVSDKIAAGKGWYWFRYSQSDRDQYLARRRFVEAELYNAYIHEYGCLKENKPVYFYLYPNLTRRKALLLGQKRTENGEIQPGIVMMKIRDLGDIQDITFTLNDSFTAYWKKARESGIKCREEEDHNIVLPDHNRVFPFSMLEQIHRKYKAAKISYEVQIWDHTLLERTRYTILREGSTQHEPDTGRDHPQRV